MRFTIVTPCCNRSDYLDETIRSVLGQKGDFEIQYVIQNGGASPLVEDILNRWKTRLDSNSFEIGCRSVAFQPIKEPDSGMYDAINRGFARGTGEVMAWINSDDVFFPGALDTVQQILDQYSDIEWLIGRTAILNARGAAIFTDRHRKAVSRSYVRKGYYRTDLPFFNWLPQDSTFWRASLWQKAGPLDSSHRLVSDFKLWQSFAKHAEPVRVDSLLGAYRLHGQQLTGNPKAYKTELGPPPRLPLGLKLACGFAWVVPQVGRILSWVPGKYLLLRGLGLRRQDILGRYCTWDFEEAKWTAVIRSAIV